MCTLSKKRVGRAVSVCGGAFTGASYAPSCTKRTLDEKGAVRWEAVSARERRVLLVSGQTFFAE